ncbi:MAG: glycosyltransferase [Alphaproteobacteria bacterium]|nr:glycosyltransferase [Alphaproteobacteria bacterium]MBU0875555.1 glycosyltransferase [Alphaproteobacteria bacterium]MBU1771318.1 glycosyltransferase [Alphaproteobacteria bacterium]
MAVPIEARAISLLDDGRRRYNPIKPLIHAHLARHFPKRAQTRILLVYVDDQIAWPQFYPFFHYADRFGQQGFAFRAVPYPALGAEHLIKDASAIFVQSPYVLAGGEIEDVFERLRQSNPQAAISYFDWFAPTDARFADRVGDYVDFYTKKSLLRDRAYYRVPHKAHTTLAEHYDAAFGLMSDPPTWECRPDIVERLTLAPAFATAPVLLKAFAQSSAVPTGPRPIDVHARFAIAPAQLHALGRVDAGERTHWYVAMRRQAHQSVSDLSAHYKVAWQGRVDRKAFMAELKQSQLCFSPFGFGEICWRDLEAVLTGAVLVKPDMGHLETFCDIYRAGETYVPVRWDLADLEQTVADLLNSPDACRAIAERAFAAIKEYLAGPKLEAFLQKLVHKRIEGS